MKIWVHTILLGVESAFLISIVGILFCNALPVPETAYSSSSQELSFSLENGQDELIKQIRICWVYYATYEDNVFSAQRVCADTNRCFEAGNVHRIRLPPHVTQVRIDFQPKDKENPFEAPPLLNNVKIGDLSIPHRDLKPFFEPTYRFAGYRHTIQPFLHGWFFPFVVFAIVIWLIVVVCVWRCVVRTSRVIVDGGGVK